MGPFNTLMDRTTELVKELENKAAFMGPQDWSKLRARAYTDKNILEGTAVTVAQHILNKGDVEAVHQRSLELLTSPRVLHLETQLQWSEFRSSAWTKGDLLEATAIAYTEYCRYHHHEQARHRRFGY